MAIFKKYPLDGNAITGSGKLLEFVNGYYETEDEGELVLLRSMACYTEVESMDAPVDTEVAPAKSTVGQQSTASLITAK